MKLLPLLLVSLLLLGSMQISGQNPSTGIEYQLIIDCPGLQNNNLRSCPVRAVDGQDAMGDPSVAVDPDIPDHLIIGSLHGSGDAGGPSNKSRSGQAFTTFTSTNHGASWYDSPFTPPAQVGGSGAYGQHPQVTIDPYGHVFVGSLYAQQGFPEDRYEYIIAAQKFYSISDIQSNQRFSGDYNAQYMYSLYPGNEIQQFWFLFNPITDNMTMVWTEKTTPYSEAAPQPRVSDTWPTFDKPAMPEFELGKVVAGDLPGARASNHTAVSSIGVVWTNTSMSSEYHYQPRAEAIGPCQTSTNPVLSEGYLYIGCKVGKGNFRWNEDTDVGRVEMFRMDPDGGTPQYIGTSPILNGTPKLGVRSDGRIALMTVDVAEGDMRLEAAYGKYNSKSNQISWASVIDYAHELEPIGDGGVIQHANIQDLIYREYSGVLHIILKQNVKYPATTELVSGVNPQPTIIKSILAVDEIHGYLDQIRLDIGNIQVRLQDNTLLIQSDGVFDDLSDDFLELPPAPYRYLNQDLGDSYEREFFAIGDYGTIIFAEIIELTNLRGPAPPPLPNPPPPPAPSAAAATSAVVTAGAALASTAMLLAAANRNKQKSAVKAKK